MCGIAGSFGINYNNWDYEKVVQTIKYRGQDSQNLRSWPEKRLLLAQSRLSILGLSSRFNQPFTDGIKSLVINGEI